jgi:hypothetical protein
MSAREAAAPERPRKPRSVRIRPIPASVGVPFVVAVALLVRAGLGYRPFPSIDDFLYVPLARAAANPALYPRDELLHGFLLHAPAWRLVVTGFGQILGESLAFWLATLALTVANEGAPGRRMHGLGGPAALLPVAVLVGFCGRMRGVGRGLYDGALGNAFHVQWLALTLLLWAYDAYLRDKPVWAGILLGCAAAAHPVVGAHGAFVLALATVTAGNGKWRQLGPLALTCLVVSLPVALPLVRGLLAAAPSAIPTATIIRDGFLFRTAHEFSFVGTSTGAVLLLVMMGLAGVLALRWLRRAGPSSYQAGFVGLLLGHALLIVAFAVFHGPLGFGDLGTRWLLPYMLHLSRTSPLFVALAGIAITAAVGVWPTEERRGSDGILVYVALLVVLATLLLVLPWRPAYSIAIAIGLALTPPARRVPRLVVACGLVIAGAAAAALWIRHDTLRAAVGPDERGLYAWVRATPDSALFIIPPGLEGFRFYGGRSAYVDFKLFQSSSPRMIAEWRRRIDQVSSPDRAAREARGWPAVPLLDRSYANRNTPARIADLLVATGADYFVWDSGGLLTPPFVPIARVPDRRLERTFANARFEVFRLKNRHGAP